MCSGSVGHKPGHLPKRIHRVGRQNSFKVLSLFLTDSGGRVEGRERNSAKDIPITEWRGFSEEMELRKQRSTGFCYWFGAQENKCPFAVFLTVETDHCILPSVTWDCRMSKSVTGLKASVGGANDRITKGEDQDQVNGNKNWRIW